MIIKVSKTYIFVKYKQYIIYHHGCFPPYVNHISYEYIEIFKNNNSCIQYNFSSFLLRKSYFLNNYLHNQNGPSDIYYDSKGKIILKLFHINGLLNNDNSPAITEIDKYFNKKTEVYYKNGKIHRVENYAYIQYDLNNNSVIKEKYFICNKLHRENGPAIKHTYLDRTSYNNGNLD